MSQFSFLACRTVTVHPTLSRSHSFTYGFTVFSRHFRCGIYTVGGFQHHSNTTVWFSGLCPPSWLRLTSRPLATAWSVGSSGTAGVSSILVFLCHLAVGKKLCHCHTLLFFTCSDYFLSSGHHHLLRNGIRTAVSCDCASHYWRFCLAVYAGGHSHATEKLCDLVCWMRISVFPFLSACCRARCFFWMRPSLLTWLCTSLSACLPRWSFLALLPYSCFKRVWHRFLGCLSLELFTLYFSQARRLEISNIHPGDFAAVCSRSGINKIWTLLRVIVWVICASHGTWRVAAACCATLISSWNFIRSKTFQCVRISHGTSFSQNSRWKLCGFSHWNHALLVRLSASVWFQRLLHNLDGERDERDEVKGEVEEVRNNAHYMHGWLWDKQRLTLEPAWAGQCACIRTQSKDDDTNWQQKKRQRKIYNARWLMHWHQLRSQISQVFQVTSHIVGIFTLHFVSTIQLL